MSGAAALDPEHHRATTLAFDSTPVEVLPEPVHTTAEIAEKLRARKKQLEEVLARRLDAEAELRRVEAALKALNGDDRLLPTPASSAQPNDQRTGSHESVVLEKLRDGETWSPGDLVEELRFSPATISATLRRLVESGAVRKVGHGQYRKA